MALRMSTAPAPESVSRRLLARYPLDAPGRSVLVRMALSDGQLHRLSAAIRDALRLLR